MTDDHTPRLAEAQERITRTAAGLAALFGPVNATSILVGAAVSVLSHAHGDETTVRYLRDLADELEQDTTRQHGHA